MLACSVLIAKEGQETPSGQYPYSAKLLSIKFSKCCFNDFKKHWNNTGTICLNIILQTWDMFLFIGFTEVHIFLMTRSTIFFSSTIFQILRLLFFLIRNQSSEGVRWRSKEASLHSENALCYRCFSRNLAKIYRAAVLTNFFRCMQNKSQWSTYPLMFFNPLMLVVAKGHTYLNLEVLVEGLLKLNFWIELNLFI